MARYIHCEKCNREMAASAKEFGELYESIEGTAIKDMFCDGGCGKEWPTPIRKGDKCFASVLLTNNQHPNYKFQKPEAWMGQFMLPAKEVSHE